MRNRGLANPPELQSSGLHSSLNLGVFTVSDIRVGSGHASHVDVQLDLVPGGLLQAGAKQDRRKLPIIWSLYPPPQGVEEMWG